MPSRDNRIDLIQKLSADEGLRQPEANAWLKEHDMAAKPPKFGDAKFDADAEKLIESLKALGGSKPARRAPSRVAAKQPVRRKSTRSPSH